MSEKPQKKIEGYIDKERNVFVVTKDSEGILSPAIKEKSAEEEKIEEERIKLLFKKYRPLWMTNENLNHNT